MILVQENNLYGCVKKKSTWLFLKPDSGDFGINVQKKKPHYRTLHHITIQQASTITIP